MNCAGCCNGSTCELGTNPTHCGLSGNVCVSCGSGLTCQGGSCQPLPCSVTCTTGCCQGNVCNTSTATHCGAGGQQCVSCGTGACQNGTCSSSTCNSMNCSGCCQGNTCVASSNVRPNACGFSGNQCTNCPQGQACNGGNCSTAPTSGGYAGSPCSTKTDCTIGGVGDCRVGTSWPGGYCQDSCLFLPCHGTDVCLSQECWAGCNQPFQGQGACRGGYVCMGLVGADGGSLSYGFCDHDCHSPGVACPSGTTCGALGYCQ
jgi:hypothetical protein